MLVNLAQIISGINFRFIYIYKINFKVLSPSGKEKLPSNKKKPGGFCLCGDTYQEITAASPHALSSGDITACGRSDRCSVHKWAVNISVGGVNANRKKALKDM